MIYIKNQTELDQIAKVAGKWYNPKTATINRRMKDPEKLIKYADKIAKLAIIGNFIDGRGEYQGRYEYRQWVESINASNGEYKERVTEYYYPIITDRQSGKDTINTSTGIITKDGDFWYYYISGIKIYKR